MLLRHTQQKKEKELLLFRLWTTPSLCSLSESPLLSRVSPVRRPARPLTALQTKQPLSTVVTTLARLSCSCPVPPLLRTAAPPLHLKGGSILAFSRNATRHASHTPESIVLLPLPVGHDDATAARQVGTTRPLLIWSISLCQSPFLTYDCLSTPTFRSISRRARARAHTQYRPSATCSGPLVPDPCMLRSACATTATATGGCACPARAGALTSSCVVRVNSTEPTRQATCSSALPSLNTQFKSTDAGCHHTSSDLRRDHASRSLSTT